MFAYILRIINGRSFEMLFILGFAIFAFSWWLGVIWLHRKYLTTLEKASAETHSDFMNMETKHFYWDMFYERYQYIQMMRRKPHMELLESKMKTKLNTILYLFRLVYIGPFVGIFMFLFIGFAANS